MLLRHEARRQADARPQVLKNRRRIRWIRCSVCSGREQSRCLDTVRRSMKGQSRTGSASKEYSRPGRKTKVESPGGACTGLRDPGTPSIP